ncbi:hypothetical protein, partial [Escherichia coli]|uniref:hypothetical protein n=1 Tax=Escherichia coli TaxID=562 RepID=UPI00233FA102
WLMMSLWDALRMNMMISYQELVRTFLSLFSEKDTQNLYLEFSCLSDRLTELLSMLTKKEQLVIRREYACHHPGG